MTRRVLAYLSAFALLFVSCSVSETDVPSSEENMLTVSLDPGKMGVTRATEYGEDKFNENVIRNFRLYFYTNGSTDDAEAVYVYPTEGYAMDPANEAATVAGTVGLDPTTGKVTVRLKLTQDEVNVIFPSMSSCRVYAVANISGVADELPSSTSVNSLKKIAVTANFGPDNSVSESPFAKVPDSFVMDGEGTLALNESSRTVSGEVPMFRAASKITFTVTKISNDDVEDKNWEPQPELMRVSYVNGINAGYVNGEMDKPYRQGVNDEYLFSYKSAGSDRSRPLAGDAATGWTHELPFYSYYNLWRDPADAANADCGDTPYILLSLPWRNAETGRFFTCWYAVPFNTLTGHLDRNTWYKINLSVSILGSGDPDDPTELTPSYMILPWGNEVETNANLMRYRYLMVDQDYYEMHNINSLSVPFISSHDVVISSYSLTYTRLKPLSGRYKPDENVPVSSNRYSVSINPETSSLEFVHNLVNDYEGDYDVSAYTLKVTIQHADRPSFYEEITIVQYPALYVRAELNSACTGDPDQGTRNNRTNRGYVYVDGNRTSSRVDSWKQVSDYSNAGNLDPYMYVVKVSSLPVGSSYTIGDPRVESYSGYSTTWTTSASWMYGANHQLSYYYPADEDNVRVNSMIAPSFRIASSYGVVNTISYADAKKRCAGYQEDGYPAGRWRVPTKAEIEYMVMLADDSKIPQLLSTDSYYWGSDKKGYRPNGNTTTSNSFVRCVYDEWYWTDKCTKNTFTWGDKQK